MGLSPATFPTILEEPQEPDLELHDLDEEFADQETKLAQLTNKCKNSDLNYYIQKAAVVIGLKDIVNTNNSNEVLFFIIEKMLQNK